MSWLQQCYCHWLILTFLCPCHCSDGSDRLRVGNQSHCTPSKVSIRGQENQWDDERDFNYLRCGGGCGETLTFPDPAQSLQGFLPIPTQMWQACVRHVPHQQKIKANTTTCTSTQNFIIYLNGWGVRNFDDLFAVHEKTRWCCRNIPWSWRGLNVSIYRLTCTEPQQYTKSPTLGMPVIMVKRGVR